MNSLNIQRVTIGELDELQKISRQTFYETFADCNDREDISKYLNENLSAAKLRNELSEQNSEFYFATINNSIIGYLKINFGQSQTELKDDNALEIERIYVLKEYHGKNVGQELYNKAIDIAQHKNVCYVWLGVWENNMRAINFYKKNGFVEFDKHPFLLGTDEQTDIMMKLMLAKAKTI